MEIKYVEDVFVTEGLPKSTFVEPPNYNDILIDLRAKTKPVILEGQTGTGKTTTIKKILSSLDRAEYKYLTARVDSDKDVVRRLAHDPMPGIYIIDDFHRLDDETAKKLADFAKRSAEEGEAAGLPKLVLVGINQIGMGLIQMIPDLAKRVGIHKIERGDSETIERLIKAGEKELNIEFTNKRALIAESQGDYWLTQKLCQSACSFNGVTESMEVKKDIHVDIMKIRSRVVSSLDASYRHAVKEFCRGVKFRPSNEPYFKLLRKVAELNQSIVDLNKLAGMYEDIKGSINNIKDKRLATLVESKDDVRKHFYYNSHTKFFSIEDPALLYYIQHLDWEKMREDCGFKELDKEFEFDIAISFAGEVRDLAKYLAEQFESLDVKVFYDELYENNYLGGTWSKEFERIFGTDSRFVIAILDRNHREKVWPTFERDIFSQRVKNGEVIPVLLDNTVFVGIPKDTNSIYFPDYSRLKDWHAKADEEIIFPVIDKIG